MIQEDYCWWKHGVVYQIYPLSFYDANNDGYGDLKGLLKKIPYLKDLGIQSIWLCPIHPSPWIDFGYDVSDYYDIHPKLGTIDDFKSLIQECQKADIKIILDFVFNHTSTEHTWFKEAKKSKESPKRDWYIWHPGKGSRKRPPNNWLAAFGGCAWEYDEQTKEYYLHSFDKAQADLNWRNPEVKAEAKKVLKYWTDLGVSGFRLDVINFFLKDKEFRSNPLTFGFPPRPYDLQKHLYDRNHRDNHKILQELRSYVDSLPQKPILIGEVYARGKDPQLSSSYLGTKNDKLHLSLDFSLFYTKWKVNTLRQDLEKCYNSLAPSAWPCQTFSNHDEGRSFTRFFSSEDELSYKALLTLLCTLKGTPFLYYGEELGLENGVVPFKERQDLLGKHYWPFYHGRDAFRTPMSWEAKTHGSFSHQKPWLPLSKNSLKKNVYDEAKNPYSFLSLTKRLINLRKSEKPLTLGNIRFEHRHPEVLSFERKYLNDEIFVLLSFSKNKIPLTFEKPCQKIFSSFEPMLSKEKSAFKEHIIMPKESLIFKHTYS